MSKPLPLSSFPAREIRAVFSDLDDTITDHSKVLPETYDAIWQLHRKGIWCVLVSGRPAGWADCLMRIWPIDAMVFENGAGLIVREGERLKTINLAGTSGREEQRQRLEKIFQRLKARIPHLKLASDQAYRLFDYAIDFEEEPPRLAQEELDWVLSELNQEREITFKLSSIHVNYWVGTQTKVTACRRLLETEGKARQIGLSAVVFAGDSPNDEPMFEFFPHTVGVANVKRYLPEMNFPPRYLTQEPRGEGFRELVQHLLAGG